MSVEDKGGKTPRRGSTTSRFGIGLAFAAMVMVAVALAGPSAGLGAPCTTCTTDGTTTTTTGTTFFSLHVSVSPSGAATLSGTGSKTCSTSCSWSYAESTTVTVTAPASGSNGTSFVGWSGDCAGTSTCTVTMDQAHNVAASYADITPPGPPVVTSPTSNQVIASAATGAKNSASITFTNPADATSDLCNLDGGAQTACSSGWNTGPLETGSHTVAVWSKDAAGNPSTSASSVTFKVANRVASTIGGTPAAGQVTATKPTAFTYGGGDTQQCSLDGGAFGGCAADVGSGLADGAHTIAVQAGTTLDAVTYWGAASTRNWTIDTHAPNTTLTSGPPSLTSDRSAVLAFSGADPAPGTALHYECSLDGGAYSACTSAKTFTGLALGHHTASVRAIDAAGNVDATPASTTWTIVTDADHDGYNVPQDCNDNNPAIHPGAFDIPDDGIDQNCDHVDAVNLDRDGDGYNRPQDCNDANPAIHPGAHDIPGNGIDEDCNHADAPLVRPPTSVQAAWGRIGKATFLPVFKISDVPSGGKVVVTCKGKGCTFKSKKVKLHRGKANLSKLMGKQRLGKGAKIDVVTTVREMLGYTIRFTIGKPGQVRTAKLCTKPGSTHAYSCS